MGFAMVFGGSTGVIWHEDKGDFPFTKGFLPIVLSWFFSPLIGGTLCATLFFLNRVCILRRKNSTNLAIYSLPVLIFLTTFINLMFVLAKGAKATLQKTWPCTTSVGYKGLSYSDCSNLYTNAVWISAVCAVFCAVVGGAIFIPVLKRKIANEINE